MSDFNTFLSEKLKDENLKKEYDRLQPEFAMI